MMNWTDIVLLSVALAMDCFAVSIANGVIIRHRLWPTILRTAILFGLFQAMMPLIGWLGMNRLAGYVEDYDHWVGFALLTFLGVRMIMESGKPQEEQTFNPVQLRTQAVQALATSIDALAVGVSLAVTGYDTVASMILPLSAIGLGSFLLSIVGFLLGIRFGQRIRRRLKPELLGGVILLFIGLKILMSHLFCENVG